MSAHTMEVVWLTQTENLHHPRQVRLDWLVRPGRFVVGAREGEEGVGAVRAVVVARAVLPDVFPVLAVVAINRFRPTSEALGIGFAARSAEARGAVE
jgi:hypothetical protein